MKKQIFNLGKALNKAEQKSINGGLKQCLCHTGVCTQISIICAELKCRPRLPLD